jgi:DNA-binding NtrC family response regulator
MLDPHNHCFLECRFIVSQAIKILVIDDEPSVGDALSIVLGDLGYAVVVVLNGRDGIELANREKFSVAITDLRLPDMSGLEVLRHIKSCDPDCPIIIITAHSTPEIIYESKRLGAHEVLSKPFFPADILSLINSGLNRGHTDERDHTDERGLRPETESAAVETDQPTN